MYFSIILPSASTQKNRQQINKQYHRKAAPSAIEIRIVSGRLHPQKILELGEQFSRNEWLDSSTILPSASTQKIYNKSTTISSSARYVVLVALFVCWDVFGNPSAGISSSVVVCSRHILLVIPFDPRVSLCYILCAQHLLRLSLRVGCSGRIIVPSRTR